MSDICKGLSTFAGYGWESNGEEQGEFKSVPGANDDIVWAGLTLMNETGKEAKGTERPLGAAEAKLCREL